MFVLGIDPGLTRCGYGVVSSGPRGAMRAVRAGVIETSVSAPVEERLGALHRELRALLDEEQPSVVVVEKVFYQRNARTAIPVAQASGIAVGLASAAGLEVRQFTAQQVKLAVTGYGAASKEQVQEMVARLLRLATAPDPPDVADALALAVTYATVARRDGRLAAAESRA